MIKTNETEAAQSSIYICYIYIMRHCDCIASKKIPDDKLSKEGGVTNPKTQVRDLCHVYVRL